MRLLLFLILITLLISSAFAQTPPAPDDKARCEVCGMFVAPFPHWIAALEMTDGQRFYFDGPKDLFKYYNDLGQYQPGATQSDVALFVTEYYTARLMSATEVFFVAGSDVLGPMGIELVPVAGREAAETFRIDHKGTGLMRFDGLELLSVPESQ